MTALDTSIESTLHDLFNLDSVLSHASEKLRRLGFADESDAVFLIAQAVHGRGCEIEKTAIEEFQGGPVEKTFAQAVSDYYDALAEAKS